MLLQCPIHLKIFDKFISPINLHSAKKECIHTGKIPCLPKDQNTGLKIFYLYNRNSISSTAMSPYYLFIPVTALTNRLSMMKSFLAICWMDFAATNAFFRAVEIIMFSIDSKKKWL